MDTQGLLELANTQTRQIATRLLDADIKLSNREWDQIRDKIYQVAVEARRNSHD